MDRRAAENMAAVAQREGLSRVIYLGGLGEDTPELSKHLRSRAEVGQVLAAGPVPATILRAGMILGSGSASFEILRYLVDRLPAMVTPRWVGTPSQPIAIRNVLGYLVGCLERPETAGRTFDIGGPEVLTYRRLMELYAEEAGLRRRLVVPVPVLTPRLSSYWIHLVTPVPAAIARPLAEGLVNPVVCQETAIRSLVPQDLLPPREAIRLALERLRGDATETHWTDAGRIPPAEWSDPADAAWAGGTVREDVRRVVVHASPDAAWAPIVRIGGANGWYHANWLWSLRGVLDRLVGGAGVRRGRRHPVELHAGDALDFWRVEAVEPSRRLLLVAEMRLPGKATLEFRLEPRADGARPSSSRRRASSRGASSGSSTGGVSPRSTGTSSRAWRARSRGRASGRTRLCPREPVPCAGRQESSRRPRPAVACSGCARRP